jgi:hypothetical protein
MNFVKVGSAVAAAAAEQSSSKLLAIQKHSSQRVLFYVHIGLVAATTNTVLSLSPPSLGCCIFKSGCVSLRERVKLCGG